MSYRIIGEHTEEVITVAFSPDGKQIASGGAESTVCLWDIESGQLKSTLEHIDNLRGITSVAFSHDGKQIVYCGGKKIIIWDVESGQLKATLEGNDDDIIWSAAFSPDDKQIVSSSEATVQLWDVQSKQVIATLAHFEFHEDGYVKDTNSAFSHDGKLIVYCSHKKIGIWNVQSREQIATLEGHTDDVNSVAFSPDGKYIVSGSVDGTTGLWNVQSKKQIALLKGTNRFGFAWSVNSVAFSADGKYIVSGDDNGIVCLWNVQSKKEIANLEVHGTSITSVAFSPDGKYIVSGGTDTTVRLCDVRKYTYSPDHVEQDNIMNTLGSRMPLDANQNIMKYLSQEEQYKLKNEANQLNMRDNRVRNMKKLALTCREYRDMVAYFLRSDIGERSEQLLNEWASKERSRLKKTQKKKLKKERSDKKTKIKSPSRTRGRRTPKSI